LKTNVPPRRLQTRTHGLWYFSAIEIYGKVVASKRVFRDLKVV